MAAKRVTRRVGTFYGIGLGPGDPELITVKARRIIQQCPVLFLPQGGEKEDGLALSVIKDMVSKENQEIISLPFPMTLDPVILDKAWGKAAELIAFKLKEGRDVAFLTLGDPLLYSTFIYVYHAVKNIYSQAITEIIPGISSISAASARALIPLASGSQRVAIITGVNNHENLENIIDEFDTVIILKISRSLEYTLDILNKTGLTEKAIVVTRCSLPGEKIYNDVHLLRGKKLDYFSLMIVRK